MYLSYIHSKVVTSEGVTRSGPGIHGTALAVLPAHNVHVVGHVTRQLAAQDGVVAVHNVLIARLHVIGLLDHCNRRRWGRWESAING